MTDRLDDNAYFKATVRFLLPLALRTAMFLNRQE